MTQTINSVKTAEVAVLPLRLNLQFFAEEDSIETDIPEEVEADETETSAEENLEIDEREKGANDSDLAEQKPIQDDETNAKFAEMRRKAEQAEARAKQADELIAQQYGESHGIYTVEDYAKALEAEKQEQERQRYLDMGIDPDEITKLVDDKLENHPAILAAKKAEYDHLLLTNFNELQSEYSDLVKTVDDIPLEVWTRWNDGENGLSLTEAYTLVNRKNILTKQAQIAKQTALNNINGKEHIKGNGGANGDIDTVEIPDDVFRMYKQLNPKATDAEIRKHYKKSIKG